MKKVFLLYPKSHNKYLIGYCTDLTEFFKLYTEHRSGICDVAQLSDNTIQYNVSNYSYERLEMYCVPITENETCFMKEI